MDMPRNLSLPPANNASFLRVRASSTLARRYLQNTKWVKNSTSAEQIKKFEVLSALFKKYAGQYDFDYLLTMAQAYQESMLDQRKHSGGTVGLMQVNPKLATADSINIRTACIYRSASLLSMIVESPPSSS